MKRFHDKCVNSINSDDVSLKVEADLLDVLGAKFSRNMEAPGLLIAVRLSVSLTVVNTTVNECAAGVMIVDALDGLFCAAFRIRRFSRRPVTRVNS